MSNLNTLNTGIRNARNVKNYTFGENAINDLQELIKPSRQSDGRIVFFLDEYLYNHGEIQSKLKIKKQDVLIFVATKDEPTTDYINSQVDNLHEWGASRPSAIVAMGGGITMDVAKAVANLLTNGGNAEDYQGWDLVKQPGIYKIAIRTISGTGSEATRTCVMINKKTGLKLCFSQTKALQ